MDFKNFSSDSTYFSLCENVNEKRKQRTNNRMSDSKFLDNVHNEVILHLQGKELIARAKVVQYMKRISRMKLKTPKDRYFVEKIQSLLLKIYNLTKQFEKSLSNGNLPATLDITGNCSLTDDFQILNADNDNPKQILLKTTSVNDEKSSFPLELLTDVNFISLSQQNVHTPLNVLSIKDKENIKELELIETKSSQESNSLNTFFMENSELYLKSNSSLSFMEDIIDTQHIPDAENLNQDKTVNSTNNFMVNDKQNNDLQSEDDTLENLSTMESLKNIIHSGECDPILKILKLCTNLSLKPNSITTIPETLNNSQSTNVINLNLRSITDLGDKLDNGETWLKMENVFTNMRHSAKNVHHILDEQLEKLHIEEFKSKEIQHLPLEKKDIHNFNEEDKRKLDIEELINMNKERLEQISEEFKTYLNIKQGPAEENEEETDEVLYGKI